jgi:hypothetical protein
MTSILPFDLSEVLQLEQNTMQILGLKKENYKTTDYFKNEVALYLYNKWILDNDNRNLIVYCFPLINSLIVKNYGLVKQLNKYNITQDEVFNELVLFLISYLPKIDLKTLNKQGKVRKIYSYFTFILGYRILYMRNKEQNKYEDREFVEIDIRDYPIDDEKLHELNYFMDFLSDSFNPLAEPLLALLKNNRDSNRRIIAQNNDSLIKELVIKTGFHLKEVKEAYKNLIDEYIFLSNY